MTSMTLKNYTCDDCLFYVNLLVNRNAYLKRFYRQIKDLSYYMFETNNNVIKHNYLTIKPLNYVGVSLYKKSTT